MNYNKHMGDIHSFDMMLYCYLDEMRTIKYWKKVSFNFFARLVLNSYVIYKENCLNNNLKPLTRYQFIISIVDTVAEDWFKKTNCYGISLQ